LSRKDFETSLSSTPYTKKSSVSHTCMSHTNALCIVHMYVSYTAYKRPLCHTHVCLIHSIQTPSVSYTCMSHTQHTSHTHVCLIHSIHLIHRIHSVSHHHTNVLCVIHMYVSYTAYISYTGYIVCHIIIPSGTSSYIVSHHHT